jgi:hypothetical protein
LPAQDGSGQGLRARLLHRNADDDQAHPDQPEPVAFTRDGNFADLSAAIFRLDQASAGQFQFLLRPEDNEDAISVDSGLVKVANGKLRLSPEKIDDAAVLCRYRVVSESGDA